MWVMTRPTASMAIRGPLTRRDLPGLYIRVCSLLDAHRGAVIRCDVGEVATDAVAIEALARFQLGARRHGCMVRLENAGAELVDLIAFMGLGDVLAA